MMAMVSLIVVAAAAAWWASRKRARGKAVTDAAHEMATAMEADNAQGVKWPVAPSKRAADAIAAYNAANVRYQKAAHETRDAMDRKHELAPEFLAARADKAGV